MLTTPRDPEIALLHMKASGAWSGSFNGKESTLQQLAPYVGKLKSGMVRSIISEFSKPGDWVCDPFAGSGVVVLEALLLGRRAAGNDLSPYAYCLTRGKAEAPASVEEALGGAHALLAYVRRTWRHVDVPCPAAWVRAFFHPRTLRESLAAFEYCVRKRKWFLAACLCGILHHQRPGFLSYPASHVVPYLRSRLFPRDRFPELYRYRCLEDRIIAKIRRVYRRPQIPRDWGRRAYDVRRCNARRLSFPDESMDLILTSPPYFGALDYARDNRLRLWFLGERDWRSLDSRLTARPGIYEEQMGECFAHLSRVLKAGKYCILVVGDVASGSRTRSTGEVLQRVAQKVTDGRMRLECAIEDDIPDVRRSRRAFAGTRLERILVFRKRS